MATGDPPAPLRGRTSGKTGRAIRAALAAAGLAIVAGCIACGDGPPRTPVREGDTGPRVVSLLPAATEIVVEVGAGDLLVARSDRDPATAHMEGLPGLGDPLAPSLEVLAEARPDLVLAWTGADREALRRALPPHGSLLLLEIRSFQDLRGAIDTVAALLGREGPGRILQRRLDADLERARRITGRDPSRGSFGPNRTHRPAVAWIVWPDPLTLAGPGTFVDELLAYAGGRNVVRPVEGSWPNFSLETLVSRDPDVLIWPEGGGIPDPAAVGRAWNRIPAFGRGRVLRIRADRFHVPGPGLGTATVRLARKLATWTDGESTRIPTGPSVEEGIP